ncbi:hypothetical protein GCM10027516_07720 [Niabella aquatica]
MIGLSFASCKKALDVKQDMYFEQVNWVDPGGERDPIAGAGPMHLELKANGFAGLYPGSGDIVGSGTYRVKGKKVKVKVDHIGRTYYEFKINSPTELTGPEGEVLRLKE